MVTNSVHVHEATESDDSLLNNDKMEIHLLYIFTIIDKEIFSSHYYIFFLKNGVPSYLIESKTITNRTCNYHSHSFSPTRNVSYL